MKLSAILAPLIAAKVSHDIIMQTVVAWEAEHGDALQRRRESDAKRQAAKRERSNSHVTSRDSHVTVSSHDARVPVEDNLLTKSKTGQKEKKENNDLDLFKAEFLDVDPELLAALITHRRTKKASLSAVAARGLRKAAGNCGLTISQAIETCIDRNWITVKPEWLRDRGSGRRKITDEASEWMNERYGNGQDYSSTIDGDVEHLPSERGEERQTLALDVRSTAKGRRH